MHMCEHMCQKIISQAVSVCPDGVVNLTLQVCLCGLVRHLPALNPAAANTGFQVPTNLSRLPETAFSLLSSVVLLMPDLMHLCTPMGELCLWCSSCTSALPWVSCCVCGAPHA